MKCEPKILYLDIENAPSIAATWGINDVNLHYSDIIPDMEWFIISGQWAWNDSKQVNTVSLLDDPKRFKKNFRDDYHVVNTLRDLIDEADIVIGHNIKGYDLKKIKAKMTEHMIKPFMNPIVIDTWQWSKQFGFTSRSLKNLCKKLSLTSKLEHESGSFIRAALGDKDAIKKIVTYGKGDIPTVRELFKRLRPYIPNQPNMNLWRGKDVDCCPSCGSDDIMKKGHRFNKTTAVSRFRCNSCGYGFSDGKAIKRVKMR